MHSDYSLLDSCTKFQDYIELAKTEGNKAIAFTEHGKLSGWVSKKMTCDAAGIRYIHGVEIYLTETLTEKKRDNYHTILLARNWDGVKELNSLVTMSCNSEHTYYTNRISFDEFLSISDNIISTSACLASPLAKLSPEHPYYMKLAQKYTFLEIQGHNCEDQSEYNKRLYELAQKIGKPLIAGTDTHSSSKYKAECRAVLLSAKHKSYGDEDSFDLSYKTYDELVEMFRKQDALPEEAYMQAIENTNLLYEMTEDFELDTSIKYPILYGSREADSQKFQEVVRTRLEDKIQRGTIPPEQVDAFRAAAEEELKVLGGMKMDGFMLSMSELLSWCKDQGMAVGPGRGSVGGSRTAYISDITDINPERWHTFFSRFANPDRVEVGDIDIDVCDEDRPAIFQHIIQRFGADKTARVASYGTIQEKGIMDDVGRHLAMQWEKQNRAGDNPWSLKNIDRIKSEFTANPDRTRGKYPELFYYFDGLLDTKVSQSVHPAGMIISPVTLADNYGTFDKDGETCLFCDMDESHDLGLVKYDFLVLKSVKVIRDCCKYCGIPYPKTSDIDFDDPAVWDSLDKCADMIFQFESPFAADSFKKFKPRSITDMSLVTAGIRPSGASYRDALFARQTHKNPSAQIDELLKNNYGYLVYQEDIIAFLQNICGLSGSEADTVRRGIAKKKMEILDKSMPKIIEGYCSSSDKPREESETELREYLKVIEDASSYMFNYSHSIAYCILGYFYGYLRYYHPLEFITSYLNNAADDDDIVTGTEYAAKVGIKILTPKWGFSKEDYFYDLDKRVIAKGMSSIKFMSAKCSKELYELAQKKHYEFFVDVLKDINDCTSVNSRQLEILIKIGFFSEFGNQRELLRIYEEFHDRFNCGEAKQIKKVAVDGTPIGEIIAKYSIGTTKSGGVAKSYVLLDVQGILREIEKSIKACNAPDLPLKVRMQNFEEAMGYAGYTTGVESDRRKLYITDIYELKRKSDGKQFGYSVLTRSIGSGKTARFTVLNYVYKRQPINKGDLIFLRDFEREGKYFKMLAYEQIYE